MKALVIRASLLIFIIISFVSKSYSENSDSNIKYLISLEKTQFIDGEDILINAKFINEGKEIDTLIHINDIEIIKDLLINDSNGNSSNYTGPVELKEENIILNPGEEYSISSPIKFYRAHRSVKLFRYFPSGTYTLKGFFDNGKAFLESNEIIFNVIASTGVDNEVFSELLKINKINPIDRVDILLISTITY